MPRAGVRPIPEVYRRADGKWDWRVKSPNGEIVATSGGQGFESESGALGGLFTAADYMEYVPNTEVRRA